MDVWTMTQYRFWQLYSDATLYTTPSLDNIDADSFHDALAKFCTLHRFRLIEANNNEMWVEDEYGALMEYLVSRGFA